MAKEYKYFVNMNIPSTYNSSTHITIKLDHPIDDPDIEAIEKQFTTPGLFGNTYKVSNYKLMKVTGDFSYHVVYEGHSTACEKQFLNKLCVLDHKVTTKTYNQDLDEFKKQITGSKLDYYVNIQSFQEIPEE